MSELLFFSYHPKTGISIQFNPSPPKDEIFPLEQLLIQTLTHPKQTPQKLDERLNFVIDLKELAKTFNHSNVTDLVSTCNFIAQEIKIYLTQGLKIGFLFQEIFLVTDRETPPETYRPEQDILVYSTEEFRHESSKFHHIISRFLIYCFYHTNLKKSPTSQDILSTYENYILSIPFLRNSRNLYTPLNSFHYFKHPFLTLLALHPSIPSFTKIDYCLQTIEFCSINERFIEKYFNTPAILAFDSLVDIQHIIFQLEYSIFQRKSSRYNFVDISLIIKNNDYLELAKRNEAYELLLQLAKRVAPIQRVKLNVFFICSDQALKLSLNELKPDLSLLQHRFTPLPHEAGYYLSCPNFFYQWNKHWYIKTNQEISIDMLQQESSLPLPKSQNKVYSIQSEPAPDLRLSKHQESGVQLQLELNLESNFSQTQTQTQTQTQSIAETLTQNTTQTQENTMQEGLPIHWGMYQGFHSFLQYLQATALKHLSEEQASNQRKLNNGYTTFNIQKFSFYKKILEDECFAVEMASRYFSCGYQRMSDGWQTILLPAYKIDGVCYLDTYEIEKGLKYLTAGYHIQQFMSLGRFFHKTIVSDFINPCHPEQNKFFERESYNKYINYYYDDYTPGKIIESWGPDYHLPYQATLILDQEIHDGNLEDYQIAIQLCQLQLPKTWNQDDFEHSRDLLFRFIIKQKKLNPDQTLVLNHLFHLFELEYPESLRIIIDVLINDRKSKFLEFINLITILKTRGLLEHFYHIYFKFTNHISSVSSLLMGKFLSKNMDKDEIHLFFHQNIFDLPQVGKSKKLSFEHQFYYHTLEYLAHSTLETSAEAFKNLQKIPKTLQALVLKYFLNNQAKVNALLSDLEAILFRDVGLPIKPGLSCLKLEQHLHQIIHYSAQQGYLEEQILVIHDLSLHPLDAPYAIEHDGFLLVSAEMNLIHSQLNPITQSYKISRDELESFIQEYRMDTPHFKQHVFRYLGLERERESIFFYRKVFEICQDKKPELNFLLELLAAHIVLESTGSKHLSSWKKENLWSYLLNKLNSKDEFKLLIFNIIQKQLYNCLTQILALSQAHAIPQLTLAKFLQDQIPQNAAPIFNFKFQLQELPLFIKTHQLEILTGFRLISEHINWVKIFLKAYFKHFVYSQTPKTNLSLLHVWFGTPLNLEDILTNFPKIHDFFQTLEKIYKDNPDPDFQIIQQDFLKTRTNIDEALELIQHCLRGPRVNKQKDFFKTWTKYPELKWNQPLSLIWQNLKHHNLALDILFSKLDSTDFELILTTMMLPQGYAFFQTPEHANSKSLELLSHLGPTPKSLQIIPLIIAQGNELYAWIREIPTQRLTEIIDIIALMLENQIYELDKFKIINEFQLKQIQSLSRLPQDITRILDAKNPQQTLERLLANKRLTQLERFKYQSAVVNKRIQDLRLKSPFANEEKLDPEIYQNLRKDYASLMQMMTKVQVASQGQLQFSIHELDDAQFPILYYNILRQQKLNLHNRRLVIALGAEALYRTTGYFPRDTQIISSLMTAYSNQPIIHEMQTGEGKSIASALTALVLHAQGYTVDIVTENQALAKHLQDKLRPFFEYFDIPCHHDILLMQSERQDYQNQGINFSTASDLSLYRLQMQIQNQNLPSKRALIWDEIDAGLNSSIDFRISCVLNPMFLDHAVWENMYIILMDFVNEVELFDANLCSALDDVHNFRLYFISKSKSADTAKFIDSLTDSQIDSFIEAALTAKRLKPNLDYVLMSKSSEDEVLSYAAPYLTHIKRPDPRLSFSKAVQQLLHSQLQTQGLGRFKYKFEPISETILVANAQTFLHDYRLSQGRIVGFTGTAGSQIERLEFYQELGLLAFKYPSFHANKGQFLGEYFYPDQATQELKIWEMMKEIKAKNSQPILVITNSPLETESLYSYLKTKTAWSLQQYSGYVIEGPSEKEIIRLAGQVDMITIANESLARGTDIDPEHPNGLLVINACTSLRADELRQIYGRAARNGQAGQYLSILNTQKLPKLTNLSLSSIFANHQASLSQKGYTSRKSLALLYQTRHLINTRYLLAIKNTAEPIFRQQWGSGYQLIDNAQLLKDLNQFNQSIETSYHELIKTVQLDDPQFRLKYLTQVTAIYLKIYESWLDLPELENFQAIEPTLPLEVFRQLDAANLKEIPLCELLDICKGIQNIWSHLGNQSITKAFSHIETIQGIIEQHQNQGLSTRASLAETILGLNLTSIDYLNACCQEFKEQLVNLCQYIDELPIISSFLPKQKIEDFIKTYIETLQKHIQEHDWDQIQKPQIDFSKINHITSTLSITMETTGILLGGPLPFLINQVILPILTKALAKIAAKVLSGHALVKLVEDFASIKSDIADVLMMLLSSPQEPQLLGYYLSRLKKLLDNKIVIGLLTTFTNMQELIPWLDILPQVFHHLEKYQELHLQDLLSPQYLLTFLQELSQETTIIDLLKKEGAINFVQFISNLSPASIRLAQDLKLPVLFQLIKVLGHPRFIDFLKALPATHLEQLKTWFITPIDNLPKPLQPLFLELQLFQADKERRLAEQTRTIRNIKTQFMLSPESLDCQLQIRPHELTHWLPQEPMWKRKFSQYFRPAFLSLGIGILATVNVFCFSYQLLISSLMLVTWLSLKALKHYIKNRTQDPIFELSTPNTIGALK